MQLLLITLPRRKIALGTNRGYSLKSPHVLGGWVKRDSRSEPSVLLDQIIKM